MKPAKAPLHFRWPAAPAFVIALFAAGYLVLGAQASEAQVLWGSSSKGAANPSAIFTIDKTTGLATLVGTTGLGDGVSAIRFDPQSGTMYGILGSSCTGARLITIDPATGAGTLVGVLVGAGFDGGLPGLCAGGSDALAFAPDGALYAGGYAFGATSLLKVDKSTGAVLEAHPTADVLAGLAFDPAGILWASHGNSSFTFALHPRRAPGYPRSRSPSPSSSPTWRSPRTGPSTPPCRPRTNSPPWTRRAVSSRGSALSDRPRERSPDWPWTRRSAS
jgi:hypothetical protein